MERILIVDDDESVIWAVTESLKYHGYQVDSAHHGLAALRQMQLQPPDLLVLDINMPGIDGVELCSWLRRDERWKSLPILFLTGFSALENKLAAYDAGADDYLSKPFEMPELAARIKALLRRGKSA